MEQYLEFKNVSKTFQRNDHLVQALDNICFHLEKGQCLAVVGESGSGKSTLAKILTGLETVSTGQILFKGKEIQNIKGSLRRDYYHQVQMVFQDPQGSFDPRFTLYDSIMEVMKNYHIPKFQAELKIDRLLEYLELDRATLKKHPFAVSGGQCQRAALLKALVLDPELLILDEATSALDEIIQYQIIELLLKLKQELNLTMIFICHDLALVQQLCNRMIVMHQGKIVESGITSQIMAHPQNKYTKQLLAAVL